MTDSLRDQLAKAGLVSKQQVKQAETENRQRRRQQKQKGRKGSAQVENEAREAAARAQAEKAARDRELNRARDESQRRRADQARIRDLIQANEVKRENGELGFNFTHGSRIKHIYVSAGQQRQLADGKLGIATLKDRYHLLPAEALKRLQEFAPQAVVHLSVPTPPEDDPYAEHPVPDDLMW